MLTLSSTLVETVSIDYEDFNESFLTCGTCLCKYCYTRNYSSYYLLLRALTKAFLLLQQKWYEFSS